MTARFTSADVEAWRRDGAVTLERFFDEAEVAAVVADFEKVFGVPEGAGAWGLAVIEAADEAGAAAIVAGDPAVRSGLGFTTDLVAMPDALIRPRAAAKAA